ncbi:MAG: alpha/beta hydrolase family protein [Streptosporangiaceae bacterium]
MSAADPRDVLTRPAPPPDQVLRYGPGPEQVADLRFPPGWGAVRDGVRGARDGRQAPVLVLLLHGGFWRAAFSRAHLGPLSAALAAERFVVCTPEFRRTGGSSSGGWPGTFDDVAAAVDMLPGLVRSAVEDAGDGWPDHRRPGAGAGWRVVLAGHSAGGHLALWAAGRHRLDPGSPWYVAGGADDTGVAGVVALAPVSELAVCYQLGLDGDAAGDLMGGGPGRWPERYAAADPAGLVPLGVPVQVVHGTADNRVPFAMSREFAERARAAGDAVQLDVLPGGGHFDVIDPLSRAWPAVLGAFRAVGERG